MNVTTASDLITNALAAGRISAEVAKAAQIAVRESSYYGQRMTNRDRARVVTVRFGIED